MSDNEAQSKDRTKDSLVATAKILIKYGKQPSKAVITMIRNGADLPDSGEERAWIADALEGKFDQHRTAKKRQRQKKTPGTGSLTTDTGRAR